MDANEIRRLIINLIRKGSVIDVDPTSNPPTCRVSVGDPDDPDAGGLHTNWLPFFTLRAGTTREWNPPTKDEQVVLFCPMGDPAQGVVLCGLYSDAAPASSTSLNTHTRLYPDGALVEYDHAAHTLTANLPAGATITQVRHYSDLAWHLFDEVCRGFSDGILTKTARSASSRLRK